MTVGMTTQELAHQAGRFRIQPKEDFPWLYAIGDQDGWCLVEYLDDGRLCVWGEDGGEPEDQTLTRDWEWVLHMANELHDRALGRRVRDFALYRNELGVETTMEGQGRYEACWRCDRTGGALLFRDDRWEHLGCFRLALEPR